jgi:hypothetical protein
MNYTDFLSSSVMLVSLEQLSDPTSSLVGNFVSVGRDGNGREWFAYATDEQIASFASQGLTEFIAR